VEGLLRVVSVVGVGAGGVVLLGVGWVRVLRLALGLGLCGGVVASVCTRFVTYVSSSPVRT